jgi:signal transduction histidine kinase
MNYQFLINDNVAFQGSLLTVVIVALIVIVLLVGVGNIIWRKVWAQLRENSVMKYEFITIIAHKFRTPLTQMKWLFESFLGEEHDSYKRQSLEQLQEANQQLISLTASLIELTDSDNSSKSSYVFEKLPLCEVVKAVTDDMKNSFHEKNIFFSSQCDNPKIIAKIDKPRIEFVLQTLLDNARTYTPTGRNVDITVTANKSKAIISVIDHGIGIAKEDLPRIFSKFYRTDNAKLVDTEGFGIGLYLAQTIVHRHGGRIEVNSDGIDKGSTFNVILPLA